MVSHGVLFKWLSEREPGRLLDVGCSDGRLGSIARALGYHVTGVDVAKQEGVGERVDVFVEADLDDGLPDEIGGPFDYVVAADVLEHTVTQRGCCARSLIGSPRWFDLRQRPELRPLVPGVRVWLGRFDYDQRGLLDRGHVRFFTRRSFERTLRDCGVEIVRREVVGSPVDDVFNGGPVRQRRSRAAVGHRPRRRPRVADDVWLPVPLRVAPQAMTRGSGRRRTANALAIEPPPT